MGKFAGTAEERFELLAGVARVSDGTMSLEETVDRLLGILVPGFCDLATIIAAGEGGAWSRLGARRLRKSGRSKWISCASCRCARC